MGSTTKTETPLVRNGWPPGAPRWDCYLAWQIDVKQNDALRRLAEFAVEQFTERFGVAPEYVFRIGMTLRAGPTERDSE